MTPISTIAGISMHPGAAPIDVARPCGFSMVLLLLFVFATGTAWGQTPTLVQHYYTGANAPPRGLVAPNYKFRLPNKTLAGNCLVLFLDYPHGSSVSSIVDDGGNTWPIAPAALADSGPGGPISAAYVLPNVAAGTRQITINFNTAVAGVKAVFLEYYNVAASSAVGSAATRITAASPSITSGTLLPAAAAPGNLVLNYAIDNAGQVGGQNGSPVTTWSAGSGWTMLGGDINNAHDTSSFALQARIADGTNFNPAMSAIQGSTGSFNSIAVELKAALAGTMPASGIRIVKQQFYVHTALAVPGTWTEFFPAQGNLLGAINILDGSTTSPLSDSNGNSWTRAHTNSGAPEIQYAQAAVTSSALKVSIPLTSRNSNTTIVLFDIVGAATTGVLAQVITIADTDASGASVANNAPAITPLNPYGLIVVATAFGQGPVTGLAPGAPPTALFMPVTYPGETDLDTFDNADAYAHNNYGADLSPQRYNWILLPQSSNSWAAAAVEFRAADGTSSSAPTGLTATVAGDSQINLAWNAPSGNGGASSYLVERCKGNGCTDFTQIGAAAITAYVDSRLATSTIYSYRVRASSPDGNPAGYSNIATAATPAAPDNSPPMAPANLAAVAASATQINLTWSPAVDNIAVTGYRVERCQGTGCTAFAQITTTSATAFSNSGVSAASSYSYRVRANDAAGNTSAYSSTASATTPTASDTSRPTAPTGLTAASGGGGRINLVWNASTENVGVTGYRVFRCQGSGCTNFVLVGTSMFASYIDSGPTSTYRYRIQAVDAAGNVSTNSNTVTYGALATGDTTAPSAPAGLTAIAASATQINLTWSAATDNVGVSGYRVERCQGAGCTAFAQIATTSAQAFSDLGVSAASSFSYRVRANDNAGNLGAYSNIVSIFTSGSTPPANVPIAFIQGNFATPQTPASLVTVKYTATQAAGDLNVVIIGWSEATAIVTSVTDTMGNVYALAAGPTLESDHVTQAIYYAKNILGAIANGNAVSVRFNAAAVYADVRILSYRGLDQTNPLVGASGSSGNSTSSNSGPITISGSNVLLVAGNTVWSTTASAGTGYVRRLITSPNGDLAADQVAASAGSYSATANLSEQGPWVMQVAAFKAASP